MSQAGAPGSVLCPVCGGEPTEEHFPHGWERFRYWLVNGSSAPATFICAQGHEWPDSNTVVLHRPIGGPRWGLPIHSLRVLLAERRTQPTPLTYVLATVAGLILGLIFGAAVGWPWWLVTTGFVFLVWLFFLFSAFWGPGSDVGQSLLRVVNPHRAAEVEPQRLREGVASGLLIGYEVENWEGEKSIGGWGGSPTPTSLTILHGAVDGDGEGVEVRTRASGDRDWMRDMLETRLAQAQHPLPDEASIDDLHRQKRDIHDAEPVAWNPAAFRVDGEEVPAEVARAGRHWAALVEAGTVLIAMIGSDVEPGWIRLTPIDTLDG